MKIDNNYTNYDADKIALRTTSLPPEKADKSTEESARSSETGKSTPDAIVNLSRASREARLIKETLDNAPDIRQEKIDRLKQEIVDNQYKVNPRAVADKMLTHFTHEFLMP